MRLQKLTPQGLTLRDVLTPPQRRSSWWQRLLAWLIG